MSRIVLLDTGVMPLVAYPNSRENNLACSEWLEGLLKNRVVVAVPEITDYEVRRGLLRVDRLMDISRFDRFIAQNVYLPITTPVMRQAAKFWAETRRQGLSTAHDHALDGDVILAAQATSLSNEGHTVTVATTNVRHLALFCDAREWPSILV